MVKVKPSRFFGIKTTAGRELDVALIIENRIHAFQKSLEESNSGEEELLARKPLDIRAIIIPPGSKGWIYIEAANLSSIYRVIQDIKYIKRTSPIRVDKEEIMKLIKPTPVIEMINVGDIVEIVKGPFRNMKAQVMDVDRNKNIVTLSILEAQFNVPITVPADYVKPVKRAGGV